MNPQKNFQQYGYASDGFPPPGGYPAPPKSKKKLIMIVLVVVLIAAAIGGVWFMQQSKVNDLNGTITKLNKQLSDDDKKIQDLQSAANTATDTSSGDLIAANAKDTERETDIKAVASHLETFNANNAMYPTFANMNDAAWIAANLKGLDKEATKDPDGTSNQFLASSTTTQYGYAPIKDDGSACDNTPGNECTKFTLTYTLSDSTQKSVTSL